LRVPADPVAPEVASGIGCRIAQFRAEGRFTVLILLIIVLLVLAGGGGYYGHSRWGSGGGAGVGLGTILVVLLVAWMLGVFH
jgi:hypothetical protein